MHITIKTPSRLHFGLLDLNGNLGRIYGSLGVALKNPCIVLEITESDKLSVTGEQSSLVQSLVKKFSNHYHLNPQVEIITKETIPLHQGLGSGTQLALAIASGLAIIYDLQAEVRELAQVMDRGKISAIGTAAFELGGFIIDGGQKIDNDKTVPPVIVRSNFPQDWRFVVAIPPGEGFHSESEKEALKKVIPSSPQITGEICQLVLMKLLPALRQKDLGSFGQALTEIDRKSGLYFKNVQGGIYKEKITEELVNFMLASGAAGAGQSSWGPAVYGLVSAEEAEKLRKNILDFFEDNALKGKIYCTQVNNHGAEISPV